MTFLRKALPLLALAAGACSDTSRTAMGDANSVIVVADDSLWAEVSDTVLSTLQPRIFAVRDEPTFLLTHVSPTADHWSDLRRFRQILAIGRPDDPWVERPLEEARETVTPPAIVEVDRVWARGQRVTVLVLPEEGGAEAVAASVDSLTALLDRRYRGWARNRMYLSGHDTALVDTLREEGGFAVDIPVVYRWRRTDDSTYVFLNDNPDASQLVRWLTVTWRTGTEDRPEPDALLAWRDSLASTVYDWGQTTQRDRTQVTRLDDGVEVRGAWSGTQDFPQAGPFIARMIDCPDQNRRYLLDTWLYAPARDKYQYMIHLETLLDSFQCA